MKQVGFSKRLGAYLIDILPIIFVIGIVAYFFFGFDKTLSAYSQNSQEFEVRKAFLGDRNRIRNLSFILWLLYCMVMEASSYQATFGKRLLGMKVVNSEGNRLSLVQSFVRNISKILSVLPVFIGFLWIGFSKKKQGWHDMLAGSYVVSIYSCDYASDNNPEIE